MKRTSKTTDERKPAESRSHLAAARRGSESPGPPRSLTVEFARIVPGGLGLGHADGYTVLAPFAAPGDIAQVTIERIQGSTLFARIDALIEVGSGRTQPGCQHFGRCGGCDLQHLTYEAQLAAKADIIRDSLRRIGGVTTDDVEVVSSPMPWKYRLRAEWICDPATPLLGYRKRGSREPFDVAACPILVPELESLRIELRNRLDAGEFDFAGEVHAAAGDRLAATDPNLDDLPGGVLTTRVAGEHFGFGPSSFFQANRLLLPALIEHVTGKAAGDASGGEAIDLYCGVGVFTIPLARRFDRVTGVEAHPQTSSYAHENVKAAGMDNVTISGLTVEQWLHRRGRHHATPAALVLDPPRTGIEPKVASQIAGLEPKRIVYVSCDPGTLARDLKRLREHGYELESIRGFDMFPQTHHVEAVATLLPSTAL